MKKAYVKPIFFAEEFVAEENYAAKGCGTLSWDPVSIEPGMFMCDCHSINHNGQADISKKQYELDPDYSSISYWEYAGAVTKEDGSTDYSDCKLFNYEHKACDFVWNKTQENIFVWDSVVVDERSNWESNPVGSFASFLLGPNAVFKNHQPSYMGTNIPS